jgi:hypothetical protein
MRILLHGEKNKFGTHFKTYLGTHEDYICIGSQPINEDLHYLNKALSGQDLHLL